MLDSIARSWGLLRESLSVLRQNKRLLCFPVLSAISTVVVCVSFILPLYAGGAIGHPGSKDIPRSSESTDFVILFVFYYMNYFITIFFNSALVAAAGRSLERAPATVHDGLRTAGNRIGRIAYWALLATTVALLLSLFKRRTGPAGRAASALFGVAWSLVTYFMVPVIVFEDRPVWESIDRSMTLCRRAWGEEASSGIGFGLIWLLASTPALIVGFASFRARSMMGVGFAVLYLLLLATVSSATKAIFTAALYRYAVHAQGPSWFSSDLLSSAFAPGDNGTLFDTPADETKPLVDASLLDVSVIPLEKGLERGEMYVLRVKAGETEYHASYALNELDSGFRADSWKCGTALKLRINGRRLLISGPGCAALWCHFTKAPVSHRMGAGGG